MSLLNAGEGSIFWIMGCISALEHVMKLILCRCVLSVFIKRINITKPERFCTMHEKCKFPSMGYISVLTQASVLIWSKDDRL